MKHRRLASGTRVQFGSILITEVYGNMRISTSPSNVITVERADIEDLVSALDRHLAKGVSVRISSIQVAEAFGGMRITTTHTPSNAITIASTDVDPLLAALKEALCHLEGAPR